MMTTPEIIYLALAAMPADATDEQRAAAVHTAIMRADRWSGVWLCVVGLWFFALGMFLGMWAQAARV